MSKAVLCKEGKPFPAPSNPPLTPRDASDKAVLLRGNPCFQLRNSWLSLTWQREVAEAAGDQEDSPSGSWVYLQEGKKIRGLLLQAE